ncbi:MAG: class I SAM-dependent methyltransferase [Actinobacteria bacterium]|nr:class I SAM-dependent methyltransferase [Actinomycetota bacterium]
MDTVNLLSRYGPIAHRLALDVGGGPGYTAQALSEAGARSVFIEYDPTEIGEGGRALGYGVIADGTNLPFASCTFDIATSLNVLEHVETPRKMMEELTRVVKPGGIVFVTFTNWLSPWGGHETSPWHYLGGEWAATMYERRYGHPPKNRYGSSLFPLRISEFLKILNAIPDIVVVDVFPRYYPYWTRWITRLPGIREFSTWNLAVAARRI